MADTNVTNIAINDTAANTAGSNGESDIIAETARHIGARPSASQVVPGIFGSVTGVQDLRQDQFYFGFAGPPEDWSDIRRSDGTPFVLKHDQLILKFGQHILSSLRSVQHSREYGVWQVIDSILTDNPPRVERDAKDDLRNRNELLSAIHKNKRSRDTELMAVNATEYKAFVEKVVTMASKYNKVNMTMEKELTKRKEAEAEARKAEARIAESNVRLLELQIKMKEIETSSSTRLCDRG